MLVATFYWEGDVSRIVEYPEIARGIKYDGRRPERVVLTKQGDDDEPIPGEYLLPWINMLRHALHPERGELTAIF